MTIGLLDAASAYGKSASLAPGMSAGIGAGMGMGEGAAAGGDVPGLFQSMVTEAAGSLRDAEAASARQVAGQGDLIDVVTAIGAAETALDTVVSVRDRVVNAYSEIMRMQI